MTQNRVHIISGSLFILSIILLMVHFITASSTLIHAKQQSNRKEKASYSILIDIDIKKIYLLKNGVKIKSYPCAVGKASTPSPIGYFKIVQKAKWGEGFGGCWLGLNCTWGKYGIHGTTSPETIGGALSHGCFRMFNRDIQELYDIVPLGTNVLVVSGCYGPFGRGFRDIGPGMYGLDVQIIQKKLGVLGYYKGSCNGKYEAYGFRWAVHEFQRKNGLPVSDWIDRKMAEKMGLQLID